MAFKFCTFPFCQMFHPIFGTFSTNNTIYLGYKLFKTLQYICFFHQNLMLILIFKIISPKNVSLKSYKHLSGDQPPVHDLFANYYLPVKNLLKTLNMNQI